MDRKSVPVVAPGEVASSFYLREGFLPSEKLTMSIFGLLSYLEPALLVVASLLNGERISGGEWFIYAAIWASVLVLIVGGTVVVLRSRRALPPTPGGRRPWPHTDRRDRRRLRPDSPFLPVPVLS